MEEEGGLRLSKRFNDGEVDYKTKAGTAWSHNFLNQKPWHPLSYPNQRRKWIAEQTHAQRQRRTEEVAREYAQEQDFFRQTSLISKKEKEKVEMMQAVSFMYVRPPGYNAESAKAAEVSDERKKLEQDNPTDVPSIATTTESMLGTDRFVEEKKKSRPKDVFGRSLPTEEEFEVLKNAPCLETGVLGRAKPFGVEIRNVKCVRCGIYGHQSGDRECPLKDAIMPTEENRLKRNDPLTAILAHTDSSEPLKWELKQKPGISPPRGGFNPDDPNQQIVAEDIFDEYGGFLGGGNIPELLTNFSSSKPKKKKSRGKGKHKRFSSPSSSKPRAKAGRSSFDDEERMSKRDKKHEKKKREFSELSSSDESEIRRRHGKRSRQKHFYSSEISDSDELIRGNHHHSESKRHQNRSKKEHPYSGLHEKSDSDGHLRGNRHHHLRRHHHHHHSQGQSDH